MCIVTEEVTGTVTDVAGAGYVTVRYDEGQRVQSGALMRTVWYGTSHWGQDAHIAVGDRVVCLIQKNSSHNDEPLLAIRKIPEV